MFSIICFSEIWSKDEKVNENSLYQLEGYNLLHQNRKHKNGGSAYLLRVHIILKKDMTLSLTAKQLKVAQLK